MSIRVQIWGPNLPTSGAQIHIHTPGCADTTRGIYRQREHGRRWIVEVSSLRDVVLAVYPPADFGYDADRAWQDFAGDIRVFPCVTFADAEEEDGRPQGRE